MNQSDIDIQVNALNLLSSKLQYAHKQLIQVSENVIALNAYIDSVKGAQKKARWHYFGVGLGIGCLFTMLLYSIGGL